MNRKIPMLRNSKTKSSMSSLKKNSTIALKLESPWGSNHTFLDPHGKFSNPENFALKSATHCSSLKFAVDVEVYAKIDTLQVKDAYSDYLFLTLQPFQGKISLQKSLNLFMIQFQYTLFRKLIGIHLKKTNLLPNFPKPNSR